MSFLNNIFDSLVLIFIYVLEELHLTFCGKNRAATPGDKFPESTYLGPHPRNRNHFVLSIQKPKTL